MLPKSTSTAAVKKAPTPATEIPTTPAKQPLPKWALPAGVGGGVVMLAFAMFMVWYLFFPDAQVSKARAAQRDLYSLATADLTPDLQKEKRDKYAEEFRKVKREFQEDLREEERKRQAEQLSLWLKRFFKQWNQDRRNEFLDAEIDRRVESEKKFAEMMAAAAKARAEKQPADKPAADKPQPPAGGGDRPTRGDRGDRGDRGGPSGGFSGRGGPGGGSVTVPGTSNRVNRDSLSAADKALYDDYDAAMKARRTERGIPAPERPGGQRPA